jgi:hypothetical protein
MADWHFADLPAHNQAKIIGAFASLMRRLRAEEVPSPSDQTSNDRPENDDAAHLPLEPPASSLPVAEGRHIPVAG